MVTYREGLEEDQTLDDALHRVPVQTERASQVTVSPLAANIGTDQASGRGSIRAFRTGRPWGLNGGYLMKEPLQRFHPASFVVFTRQSVVLSRQPVVPNVRAPHDVTPQLSSPPEGAIILRFFFFLNLI